MNTPSRPGSGWGGIVLAFVADILLAGLLFVGIAVVRIGQEGFRSTLVSPGEFRDWLIVLTLWGVVMAAIAVAGALRRRLGIVILQAAVMVVVLAAWTPTFARGWHESHQVVRQPETSTPFPSCVHGNCPGG